MAWYTENWTRLMQSNPLTPGPQPGFVHASVGRSVDAPTAVAVRHARLRGGVRRDLVSLGRGPERGTRRTRTTSRPGSGEGSPPGTPCPKGSPFRTSPAAMAPLGGNAMTPCTYGIDTSNAHLQSSSAVKAGCRPESECLFDMSCAGRRPASPGRDEEVATDAVDERRSGAWARRRSPGDELGERTLPSPQRRDSPPRPTTATAPPTRPGPAGRRPAPPPVGSSSGDRQPRSGPG